MTALPQMIVAEPNASEEDELESRAPTGPRPPVTDPTSLRTIVVGADGSASGQVAMTWASILARSCTARVVIVHAVPIMECMILDYAGPGRRAWRQDRRRQIEGWCGPLRERQVAYQVRVVERAVAAAILSIADEQVADLIVVGANRHTGHSAHLQATLGTHLSHHAACPVMDVPVTLP